MALICNLLQQASHLDKLSFFAHLTRRFAARKLVELLVYLNRRLQALKNQLERIPDDVLINKYPFVREIS